MLEAYDPELIDLTRSIAKKHGIPIYEGVYAAVQGPNLETAAEYNYLHVIGGDLVGMSTVPEVIVARHAGIRVLLISLVSNECFPLDNLRKTTIESVLATAEEQRPKLHTILFDVISTISAPK